MPLVLLVVMALSIEVPVPLLRDAPESLLLRRPFHLTNPAPDEHDLAIYEEDEWNRALVCPRDQTVDGETHLCTYTRTGTLAVGDTRVWTGATQTSHEWDGMYGVNSEVVLVLPLVSGPRILGTLTQWHQSVVDCYTSLRFRRHRTRDLDRDGLPELCIETVLEEGEGLFHVMDLDDHGKHWRPITRARTIHAWRLSGDRTRMLRFPTLDHRCPSTGYEFFTPFEAWEDAVGHRSKVQGKGGRLARCPRGASDSCFELDACK
jgi:hypothetical protein